MNLNLEFAFIAYDYYSIAAAGAMIKTIHKSPEVTKKAALQPLNNTIF